MRLYYDTEFVDDGKLIKLVSIGMVAEDGRELYAVVADPKLINEVIKHPWLSKNVLPSLPVVVEHGDWDWDTSHQHWPLVLPRKNIARYVETFIRQTPKPELWAWYGAYDHVALAQLFGPMSALPDVIPMWTNDLKQECVRLGNPRLPAQSHGVHNALEDARHNKVRGIWLQEYERHDRPRV